ncbi:MAG: ABC transporter permease/substrate-binding protein [Phenylobacterium sp.]|uniref:ABC transporter permease/substrate-binding protein n=1 Tax=Phenylobacterium sp. TaxID=1871053 RepID=UPI001B7295A4|nr:ABC transporter permease/substrate-binding protein [Phenylobacterium sp.]MBP7815647.1 ABC transporter permease/substrate-binding protein [Phenylobacterium sp.]MBP9229885.1 ABC transporter permease/substrate-binding protein [Phenylobacterium sp.]MBP9753927.1 ABC transporter permease/substrate-binding protein [Phenylobacterium sp.]
MSPQLAAAFDLLPDYLAWHVLLSACALALGLIISLPLAVAASRSPRLRWPVLAFAGLIQTIPSLALLALFYPLLLAVSALSLSLTGYGFSALGFLPSLLALTLYSMLPILRTATTGILGVDPAVREAADGVGMTARQKLLQVELPLAMPVIMAGVRTAAVWTIGAATLSTPVGQTSLGNYIFAGLQTENWVSVLFGCAASAVLAMTADQLLGLIETGAARRNRRLMIAGGVGLLVGIVVAVLPLASFGKPASYVVGAKNFSEQYILAELMADRLEHAGGTVSRKEDLGSAVAYRALAAGELDVYVDYTGTLWTNVLNHQDNPGRQAVLDGLTTELKARDGVTVLGSLGFENAYAFAMNADRAKALGIVSLADLAREAPKLTLGTDIEFLSRPEWKAVDAAYGFRFKARRSFQPTFMYRALSGGEADVISAFSSDGRIAADKLVVLTDPKGALPPYDAVILVSPARADDQRLIAALRPLVGSIPVAAMQGANYSVDRDTDKASPAEAARGLSK